MPSPDKRERRFSLGRIMRVLRVSWRTFTLLFFPYPRNRTEPIFAAPKSCRSFPVLATVRFGLSILQSGKVKRSDCASPTKKRSRHRVASQIVRIFSGIGDCPARPEHLAVREGCTKRLSEPDQKAQSPSCGRPVSCRVFQDVGHVPCRSYPGNRAHLVSVQSATIPLRLIATGHQARTKHCHRPNLRAQSPYLDI